MVAPVFKRLAILSLLAVTTSFGAMGTTPLELTRAVRVQGCRGRPGTSAPLRYVGGLNEASLALSHGVPLKSAVAQAGYREQESTSVHVSGDSGALKDLLANQLCGIVVDPRFSDLGITQHGRDTWMIFAVPFRPPSTASSDSVGSELLARINSARAHSRRCGSKLFAAAPPLQANALLRTAAQEHAHDMLTHNYFAHEGHDGSNPAQRVAAAGYRYRIVGENIASGPENAADAVAGWIASPEHCENLMDVRFTDSGVAYAASSSGAPRIYWVQDFGRPR
jgi:uncharacterized protein YkwD